MQVCWSSVHSSVADACWGDTGEREEEDEEEEEEEEEEEVEVGNLKK